MIKDEVLLTITGGGFSFSATMINALARGAEMIFEIGKSVGSSIRMLISGNRC